MTKVQHPGGLYVSPGSKPIVLGLSPASTKVDVATWVTLTGGGFTPASVVKLDGNVIAQTFIDDTHVKVFVPSFGVPGAKAFTVTTGALVSNPVNFQITLT